MPRLRDKEGGILWHHKAIIFSLECFREWEKEIFAPSKRIFHPYQNIDEKKKKYTRAEEMGGGDGCELQRERKQAKEKIENWFCYTSEREWSDDKNRSMEWNLLIKMLKMRCWIGEKAHSTKSTFLILRESSNKQILRKILKVKILSRGWDTLKLNFIILKKLSLKKSKKNLTPKCPTPQLFIAYLILIWKWNEKIWKESLGL